MPRLLKSAKFWTMVIDGVVATLAIVLTWFLSPDKVKEVLTLLAIWQPVVLAVILGDAWEDAAQKASEK